MTPTEILATVPADERVIWKSDIDGLDIHVLTAYWAEIRSRCAALWFEFDPAHTLGPDEDVAQLVELLADSGECVLIFDNLGREMICTTSPDTIRDTLTGLTQWTKEQVGGHTTVPYVDVWLIQREWSRRIA